MEGKRRLSGTFLGPAIFAACTLAYACTPEDRNSEIEFTVCCPPSVSKAMMPDEDKVSDMNLLIYDSRGDLEFSTFVKGCSSKVSLLRGKRYTFCACINFGYTISAATFAELSEATFHLAYPDEYREGIPMCALVRDHLIGDEKEIILEPVRLMSRISIRMDRSRLTEDVKADVTAIRIGNCPKKVRIIGNSRVQSEDDCFSVGFSHEGSSCSALNRENHARISESISLFMLENMQGSFAADSLSADEEKVFPDYDSRRKTCSFVEIEMDYSSQAWISEIRPLKYRFYLGEDRSSLDVERNCHYHITVCPENDGLDGDGWRVDKSGLTYIGETSLVQYPDDYIVGNVGDRIHIGCLLTPSDTPFDVGMDYMRADKDEGIYDYEIDPDGHGATLTLTGPGRGMIYMEAGAPIDDAALFMIEVNRK